MISNGNEPAFPVTVGWESTGVTKRELFAVLIAAGMGKNDKLMSYQGLMSHQITAIAVDRADLLLADLERIAPNEVDNE